MQCCSPLVVRGDFTRRICCSCLAHFGFFSGFRTFSGFRSPKTCSPDEGQLEESAQDMACFLKQAHLRYLVCSRAQVQYLQWEADASLCVCGRIEAFIYTRAPRGSVARRRGVSKSTASCAQPRTSVGERARSSDAHPARQPLSTQPRNAVVGGSRHPWCSERNCTLHLHHHALGPTHLLSAFDHQV